jgi:hypothetical protein
VEHFINSIDKMGTRVREHAMVSDIARGLKDIMAEMEGAVDGFTKDSVRDIGKVCDTLLKGIQAAK